MNLQINGVSYSYPGQKREVLKHISFNVMEGEVFCLLGPNGCGKSTLLNCISGLNKVKTGDIRIDNNSIFNMRKRILAQQIGYVPQFHQPTYDYTIREFVVMGRSPYIPVFGRPTKEDYAATDEALYNLNIEYMADQYYTQISGGERQLALFARVIAQRPKFILLDEPTASLDFGNQQKIIRQVMSLAHMGFAIIMTTHHPDHALIAADQVGIMRNGVMEAVGKPNEVITEDILGRTYNTNVIVEYVASIGRSVCIAVGG